MNELGALQDVITANRILQEQMKWAEYSILFLTLDRPDLSDEARAKSNELQHRLLIFMNGDDKS